MIYSLSFLLIVLLAYVRNLRDAHEDQRAKLLKTLGIEESRKKKIVGFFHPYCNAGGGGERVLWAAVSFIQRTEPEVVSVVYSGDKDATKEQIIAKVKSRFDITLSPDTLHFIFLDSREYVEDARWPRFTLLGQSLGSMYLAWEAMSQLVPDLYIDTMGYAFTFYAVAWLTGVPIGAYVHYPTISTDMLARVQSRKTTHTNSDAIASSPILSRGKLLYYRIFMYHYAQALRHASFIMVNSSWTKNHVDSILAYSDPLLDALHLPLEIIILPLRLIFKYILPTVSTNKIPRATPKEALIVYPSCDTREMSKLPLEGRERMIISICQFRPEKDHPAQLRALSELLRNHSQYKTPFAGADGGVRLVLIGGSRNDGDAARIEGLRRLAKELDIEDHLEFAVNAPFPEMLTYLARASIGLNTMVDEHFGINVVEYMAAGLIPISHASGGPLHDIIVPYDGQPTGFHARDPASFAEAIYKVLSLPKEEDLALRQRARARAVEAFSEQAFEEGWQASGWRQWL
ncbi:mannosyltransferase [Dentipellis sp. KUC8613]|nr:mannosyltransferase [Dentipellis sp. KUC8613]